MAARSSVVLTKRLVDQAAAVCGEEGAFKEIVLWDHAVRGFGLKVSPSGSKAFILLYRAGRGRGFPLRKWTIGAYGSPWTVETARSEARRLLAAVAGGGDPAAEKAERRQAKKAGRATKGSVAALADEWLARDQASNRTVDEVRRVMLKDVLPAWGERQLTEIRKRDVITLLDGISDRGAAGQANRTLAYVRRFLNWAAARDLVATNVAQHVEKVAPENRRDRVLADEEIVEVWRAAETTGGPVGTGLRLLILTGARLSEVYEARWSELDLDREMLRLPASRSKNKEGRDISLSAPAVEIIRALPRYAESDWLLTVSGKKPFSNFGHAKTKVDQRIQAARVETALRAGSDPSNIEHMPGWVFHDFRRSVATGLQRLGVRLEAIETVLGHISGSRSGIVGNYQKHRFREEARSAIDAWGRHIEGLVAGRQGNVVDLHMGAA